jgi:DNA-binding transcriptional MerR regulator
MAAPKSNVYCGMGDVPPGKIRGTAKQCLQMNQVRYYGLHKLPSHLLDTPVLDPDKEHIRVLKLEMAVKGIKKMLDAEKSRKPKKQDVKKIATLKVKGKKKLAEYRAQMKVYEQALEEDNEEQEDILDSGSVIESDGDIGIKKVKKLRLESEISSDEDDAD